ncbi:MAG: hypothetical protein ACREEP_11215, partial [Dongiaceae bacterium]
LYLIAWPLIDSYAGTYLTFVVNTIWSAIGSLVPSVAKLAGFSCASMNEADVCRTTIEQWVASEHVVLRFKVIAAALLLLGVAVACRSVLRDARRTHMIEA